MDVAALASRGVETHGVEFGQFTGVVAGGEWMRAPEPATICALLERAGSNALLTVANCYV